MALKYTVKTTLLTHVAVTLFMVGIIWFIQIVHYPLFDHVSEELSVLYEIGHVQRTIFVVGPLMAVEGISGVLLLALLPSGWNKRVIWLGMTILLVIWLSSFFLQVPLHYILRVGFNKVAHQNLVFTNWIRTLGWSLRGALMFCLLWRDLSPSRELQ